MSNPGPLANGLYPIIRRARRPFIISDDDAGPRPAPAPVAKPTAAGEAAGTGAKLQREKERRAIGEAKQ
jgi:hypothetical protein